MRSSMFSDTLASNSFSRSWTLRSKAAITSSLRSKAAIISCSSFPNSVSKALDAPSSFFWSSSWAFAVSRASSFCFFSFSISRFFSSSSRFYKHKECVIRDKNTFSASTILKGRLELFMRFTFLFTSRSRDLICFSFSCVRVIESCSTDCRVAFNSSTFCRDSAAEAFNAPFDEVAEESDSEIICSSPRFDCRAFRTFCSSVSLRVEKTWRRMLWSKVKKWIQMFCEKKP